MNAPDLLEKLTARGVKVCADDGLLRVRPARAVPDELRGALLELKPELLKLLSTPPITATAPDVAPALIEYPNRTFDERLRLWKRENLLEYTRGTAPAYRKLRRPCTTTTRPP